MQITVRYFAAARDAAGTTDAVVDVDVGCTVAQLRARLAASPALARVLRQSRLAVDQRFVTDDVVLDAGVEVAVIPPVAGG
ncbi:MAG TPA: molybdopterin converting factor subunit 1 [Myxococcota bacterium]